MKVKINTFTALLLFALFSPIAQAQQFGFTAEMGFMRSQVDGDKLMGYDKNSFVLGIGSNYRLGDPHFLNVKTTYYNQGSERRDIFQEKLEDGIQLEFGMSSIAVEVSYQYAPVDKYYFMGVGLALHRMLDYDYKIIDNKVGIDTRLISDSSIRSGFQSLKAFYGWRFGDNIRAYFHAEHGVTNIMRSEFFNIRKISPYSIGASVMYEIRPGEKKKKKSRKKKRRKKRR